MDSLRFDRQGAPLFDEREENELKESFFDAVCLMRQLRRYCPWDAAQSPETLKRYVVEEAYEVVQTIDERDWGALKAELGDFVFQVLFQAEIQTEQGRFSVDDVLRELVAKMVRRHPHVFGEEQGRNLDAIKAHWHQIKREERGQHASLFADFPRSLPALQSAYKIGKKTEGVAFDWATPHEVVLKIHEELDELNQALAQSDRSAIEEEMGDFLFTMAQLCRKMGMEPEDTLRQANRKFIRRFQHMERLASERGLDFKNLSPDEKERLWDIVKAGS
ncbi:MAG: nucleoside triphosphate pyrophosphohydrolase [Acidobacteria bacterium]|nr:nucleoside triphosphate pyrophosphohydrolase [Acidobacteriota bacterium]